MSLKIYFLVVFSITSYHEGRDRRIRLYYDLIITLYNVIITYIELSGKNIHIKV